MGQRTAARTARRTQRASKEVGRADLNGASGPEVAIFPSALGWFGLLGVGGRVIALTFAHATAEDARKAVEERRQSLVARHALAHGAALVGEWREADWSACLRAKLQRFAEGEPVDFDDCDVALPALTDFQQRVIAATRRIRYGTTRTYSEVAEAAGNPGAARAVGSVMKANAIPLIVPCHRVVAAGGLGGYSAAHGLELKRSLLEMEGAARAGK